MREPRDSRGVKISFNRPPPDDSLLEEAELRTTRHRPGFPGASCDLGQARRWIDVYVEWLDERHHHFGFAFHTPSSVYDGAWARARRRRCEALRAYHEAHPDRFHAPPPFASTSR